MMNHARKYHIDEALGKMKRNLVQLTEANLPEFYEKARRLFEPEESQFSYRFRERKHGESKGWQRLNELLNYERIAHNPSTNVYTVVFREAPHQRFDISGPPLFFAFDGARALYVRVEEGERLSEEFYVRRSPRMYVPQAYVPMHSKDPAHAPLS